MNTPQPVLPEDVRIKFWKKYGQWLRENLSYDQYFKILDFIQEFNDDELTRLEAEKEAAVEKLEEELEEEMENRDYYSDMADQLAYKVSSLARPGVDPIEVIGEHSSHNDPWQNALDLEPLSPQQKQAERSRPEIVKDGVEQTHDKYKKTFEHLGGGKKQGEVERG